MTQALKDGFEQETFAVDVVYDGEYGYATASEDQYDLLILDVMLPGMSGLEIVHGI